MIIPCGNRRLEDYPEYSVWKNMKQRCNNPSNKSFHCYGGRGIRICKEWAGSFLTFYRDMGPRPAGATLDRIDNDGHYSPKNCRWATARTQNNNKTNNRFIRFHGVSLTAAQWSRRTGIPASTIQRRLCDGWPLKDVFLVGRRAVNRRGNRNQAAKLRETEVLEIRRLLQGTEPQEVIAKRYGVSVQTISAIKTRAAWGHL